MNGTVVEGEYIPANDLFYYTPSIAAARLSLAKSSPKHTPYRRFMDKRV